MVLVNFSDHLWCLPLRCFGAAQPISEAQERVRLVPESLAAAAQVVAQHVARRRRPSWSILVLQCSECQSCFLMTTLKTLIIFNWISECQWIVKVILWFLNLCDELQQLLKANRCNIYQSAREDEKRDREARAGRQLESSQAQRSQRSLKDYRELNSRLGSHHSLESHAGGLKLNRAS